MNIFADLASSIFVALGNGTLEVLILSTYTALMAHDSGSLNVLIALV